MKISVQRQWKARSRRHIFHYVAGQVHSVWLKKEHFSLEAKKKKQKGKNWIEKMHSLETETYKPHYYREKCLNGLIRFVICLSLSVFILLPLLIPFTSIIWFSIRFHLAELFVRILKTRKWKKKAKTELIFCWNMINWSTMMLHIRKKLSHFMKLLWWFDMIYIESM